jgi:uncharacterized protein HemX
MTADIPRTDGPPQVAGSPERESAQAPRHGPGRILAIIAAAALIAAGAYAFAVTHKAHPAGEIYAPPSIPVAVADAHDAAAKAAAAAAAAQRSEAQAHRAAERAIETRAESGAPPAR